MRIESKPHTCVYICALTWKSGDTTPLNAHVEVHCTGECKLLDQSREEQESAGRDPCWVQAGLTTLQERSCRYYAHDSERASLSCYKFVSALVRVRVCTNC